MTAIVALALAWVLCLANTTQNTGRWRAGRVQAVTVADAGFATREALPTPGVAARAGVASPTRAPWIVASGWRIARQPERKYSYSPAAGAAALAAAEAHAYGADAVIRIDPADATRVEEMAAFLNTVPPVDLPIVADFGLVDDGSAVIGEVMNLLTRRNLLYKIVAAPSPQFPLNVVIGSKEYPEQAAADPSAFAQRVRRDLTDETRSLRLYGSEVVIGRLTGTRERARLQLINYGGRDIEGLRVRVRGSYRTGEARVSGIGAAALTDHVVGGDGATEFSLPRLTTYAVIDLR